MDKTILIELPNGKSVTTDSFEAASRWMRRLGYVHPLPLVVFSAASRYRATVKWNGCAIRPTKGVSHVCIR